MRWEHNSLCLKEPLLPEHDPVPFPNVFQLDVPCSTVALEKKLAPTLGKAEKWRCLLILSLYLPNEGRGLIGILNREL